VSHEPDNVNMGEDQETLKPIAATAQTARPVTDLYSRLVFILSVLLALISFGMSAFAFAGFAENDTGAVHLSSAFLLCFGVGALAYVPLGIIAIYARKAVNVPLPRYRAIVTLLLVLPWFGLCYYLLRFAPKLRVFAIISIVSALFITFWAIRYLRQKSA